ncbi:hypothetical protein J5U23_02145 [Saccharolobus shibatae B12]|uniref:Uncharacterized protein n=2 Tax=Saccharolobus shibatae TaxID=2286 RepID=A0A8F5BQ63_SACSH|nr:hypothetical protein [Saccharolobus shibatae]QXJ29276.1 hypothetical protein J5U23_02145 [Saccharolobus shibatae B12]
MIIGIGKGPLSYFAWKHMSEYVYRPLYPYPLFYDAKRDLLTSKLAYIDYLRRLQVKRNEVKIAVYPDYVLPHESRVNLSLLKSIEFIVPIHSLEKDITIVEELQEMGFKVYYGYASDKRYRSYTLSEFLSIKGRKWYLGISTMREFEEALRYNFDGIDITGYLLRNHKIRKDSERLKRRVEELIIKVKQKRITDFIGNSY